MGPHVVLSGTAIKGPSSCLAHQVAKAVEMMVVDALAWTTASILLYFDRLCYLFCCLQVAKAVEMMVMDALASAAGEIGIAGARHYRPGSTVAARLFPRMRWPARRARLGSRVRFGRGLLLAVAHLGGASNDRR